MNKYKNKNSGFIETIIIIVVALLVMKFSGITVSEVVAWGKLVLNWFLSFFKDVLK